MEGLGMIAATVGQEIYDGINIRARDNRAQENQLELMEQQFQNQNRLNKKQFERQFEMWLKTNYSEQVKQMKMAGLNPALMYKGSGAGGTTGGLSAGQAAGGNAPSPAGLGMAKRNTAMELSQIQLNQAQARKLNADADYTEGSKTEETMKRIEDITQGIENKKALKTFTDLQSDYQRLENRIKNQTLEKSIKRIINESEKAGEELRLLKNDADYSDDTYDNRVNILNNEYLGLLLDNTLRNENIELTVKKREEIVEKISQLKHDRRIDNKEIGLKEGGLKVEKGKLQLGEKRLEVERNLRSIGLSIQAVDVIMKNSAAITDAIIPF